MSLDIDAAHAATIFQRILEDRKARIRYKVRKIAQLQPKARIRFVRAVARHGLIVRKPRQRQRYLHTQRFLKQPLQEALVDLHDILLLDEGHLKVDLRKVRLAIRAQILVAEAAGNLHVAVIPR